MKLTQDQLQTYDRDGYVFVQNLLCEQEVDLLRNEAKQIISQGHPSILMEKDGTTPRTIANPQTYNDVFLRLVRHPKLVEPAMQLCGGPVYVFQMGVNYKSPFTGDTWWWHQDYPTYFEDDGIPTPKMVNCIIFLDEVSEFNGPLMLIPGSQNEDLGVPEPTSRGTSYKARYARDEDVTRLASRSAIVAPKGPAGCVNFQHTNIMHGSAANLSPWRRAIITLTFNAVDNKSRKANISDRPEYLLPRDLSPVTPLGEDCLLVSEAHD